MTADASTGPDTSVADAGSAPTPITGFDAPSKWVLLAMVDKTLYEAAADTTVLYMGEPTGRLRGRLATTDAGADPDAGDAGTDPPFGGLIALKSFALAPYLGNRVRMTGYIKTEGIPTGTSGATLWLRFDGPKIVRLANGIDPTDRSLKGTQDFTKFEHVVDVPETATGKAVFGAILNGEGTLWVGGVTFEVVDQSVPTTPFEDVAP